MGFSIAHNPRGKPEFPRRDCWIAHRRYGPLSQSLVAPLAVNYVIGVEHQLMGNLVAGANYSGSKSYNGLNGANVNYFPGGATFSTASGSAVESIGTLSPNFGSIIYVNNANQATYNSMILFLRGKAGHRGAFQGSYTLSHAKDYPEANTRFDQDDGVQHPATQFLLQLLRRCQLRCASAFLVLGIVYVTRGGGGIARVLTSGWEASSIIAIQTGTPFWVVRQSPR